MYSATSRGYFNTAAQAVSFEYIFYGKICAFWGTSCSAPAVAGVISLLNDYRLSRGSPPFGWLSPWLYGNGLAGLNDITYGSNPGCNTAGLPAIVAFCHGSQDAPTIVDWVKYLGNQ